jgi:hypothetical protein
VPFALKVSNLARYFDTWVSLHSDRVIVSIISPRQSHNELFMTHRRKYFSIGFNQKHPNRILTVFAKIQKACFPDLQLQTFTGCTAQHCWSPNKTQLSFWRVTPSAMQ